MTFNISELLILGLLLILSTIAFIQWINPVYDESVKVHYTTRLLNFFWIIALIFIIYIILLITNELPSFLSFNDTDNTGKTLLSAVGISLSAFIASASVMKSIANTNNIEQNKLHSEKVKSITFLTIHLAQTYNKLKVLDDFLESEFNSRDNSNHFYIDRELIVECRRFFISNEQVIRDKEVLYNLEWDIINKLYSFNDNLQKKVVYFISNNSIHKKAYRIHHNFDGAKRGIKNIYKDFEELEKNLIEKYSKEIPTLEIIFNETYKNTTF